MLVPRRDNGFNIFDEVFNDPFFSESERVSKLMKTDVQEVDGNYLLEIDVPGYDKENIQLELNDGYLTVTATKNEDNETKKAKYLKRERFSGICSRSFFVGEDVKEEVIKANFKNGILSITFPKEVQKQVQEKKYIQIGD